VGRYLTDSYIIIEIDFSKYAKNESNWALENFISMFDNVLFVTWHYYGDIDNHNAFVAVKLTRKNSDLINSIKTIVSLLSSMR
jgi:hypothetical protein